jgi:hypothetical protein
MSDKSNQRERTEATITEEILDVAIQSRIDILDSQGCLALSGLKLKSTIKSRQ